MAGRRIRLPPPPHLPPVFERDESHTLVDDFTLRAERHRARQAPALPVVQQIPLRKHPMWSGNNEIGRSIIFDAGSANSQMVIKMEEWDEPIQRTISLGMTYDESVYPVTPLGFGILAQITIGVGGAAQQIDVDWTQGTTLTVTANSINVQAKFDLQSTVLQGGSDVVPPGLQLSALISKGLRASRPPTRTFYLPTVGAGGASNIFQIPFFAKEVMLFDRLSLANASVYDAATELSLLTGPNAGSSALAIVDGATLLNFAGNGYPIPNGAKNFSVANGGADNLRPGVLFKLAF